MPSEPSFHRTPEPWSLLDLLFFAIFFFAALFITGSLALAGYALLRPALGLHGSAQAMGKNTFFLLGVQVVFYVLVFGYIYFLVVHRYRLRFWEGIKWGPITQGQTMQYIIAGVVMTVVIQLLPVFLPDKNHFPLEKLFSSPGSSYAIALFAVLVAPFMEELIFRGVLFSIFEARAGVIFAVVATAVLFAAMHIPEYRGAWDHVFLIFLVGLVLSLTRGFTKTLAPSVILHVTYNGCLMVIYFIATSHFRMMQGLLGK
ncbi:MAG: CPBP family intramembrane metalloprotease [Acidobacteriota bacterium]|nr:CPBP family intramembrane metalloprotease [Acidobacteriota bacterium]